jgi:hypothetical protein
MKTTVSPTIHKTVLGRLLASIGGFITHLLNSAKNGYNAMPADQQQALVKGVNISQLIKDNYTKGETALVNLVATELNISPDVASSAILSIAKDSGINTGKIQDYLDSIANKVQAGITDNGWNALWQTVAQFATSFISGGSVNWVSLGLGVVEFCYQHFIKKA